MIYQIPVGTGFEMRRKMFPALVFLPVLWYAGIRQKTTGVDTMAEQEMLLDTATIKAAVAGEKWAKQRLSFVTQRIPNDASCNSLAISVLHLAPLSISADEKYGSTL